MGNDRAATLDILGTTNTTPNTTTQNRGISSVGYSPYRTGSFIQECSAYGNNHNTSHIGTSGPTPSICSSMNLFEDLFSKADKLISSGKKRDNVMCDVSKAGPNTNLMKKYSRPEEERLKPKLDSRIDAIIKRYSGGASTVLDSPRGGSRYPLCPITTSPMTFTPTFPEGCSGFGSYIATGPLYCSNNDDVKTTNSCSTKKNKGGNRKPENDAAKPNTARGVSVGGARGKSFTGGAESRGKSFAGGAESRGKSVAGGLKASTAFQERSNTKAEIRNCHFQGGLEKPEAAPNAVAKNRLAAAAAAAARGGTVNAGNTKTSVRGGGGGALPISAACQACNNPSKKSPMNKTTTITTSTPKTAGGGGGGGGGGGRSTNKSGNKSSANYGGDRTNNGGCPCAQGGAGGAGGNGMMPSNQPVFTPDGVANTSSYEVSAAAEAPARSGEGMQGCCGEAVVIDGMYGSPEHSVPAPKARRSTKVGKKRAPKPRHLLVAEAKRVYGENQQLRLEGMELRKEMECTRKGLMIECAKVLHSVLSFCEHRSKKEKAEIRAADKDKLCGAPCPQSRKGAGCSSGMCGGYTPSGWNKANALSGVEESGCLPPRTIPPPCPTRGGGGESQCPQEGQDAVSSGVVDCNMCPSVRILGEMVFQLERRILEYVFGVEGKNKRRFYGYTVSNVCYMITKESHAPSGKTDSIGRSDKSSRFEKIICALQKYGYDVKIHPEFCQNIVNKFGVLACPPDQCTIDSFRLQDPCAMSALISKLCGSPSEVVCLNIILRCLAFLARCDGKPMFVW